MSLIVEQGFNVKRGQEEAFQKWTEETDRLTRSAVGRSLQKGRVPRKRAPRIHFERRPARAAAVARPFHGHLRRDGGGGKGP